MGIALEGLKLGRKLRPVTSDLLWGAGFGPAG